MPKPEILLIPNLLSLLRIVLTPLVGYMLWLNTPEATVGCVILLVIAGITDALDGYLARRMGLTSKLGLVLDPLADKIFAAVLLVEVVLFRGFPVWLAAIIVGRDVAILIAGIFVLGRKKVAMASTIIGQYAFFAIVLLIGFAVIKFDFGVKFIAFPALGLIAASVIVYARALLRQLRNQPPARFVDKPVYRAVRVGATAVVLVVCLVVFIFERT